MPKSKITLQISHTLLFLGALANTYLLNYSHILYLNVKLFGADDIFVCVRTMPSITTSTHRHYNI